jgi:hypothetical protein
VGQVLTLRLPYPDADDDGFVDGLDPAVAENLLTLWRYVPAQETWVRLDNAVVLTDANMVLAQTTELGLFVIVRATDGSVPTVGTASDYPVQSIALSGSASATGNNDFVTLGTPTVAPYVVAWDTTQVDDGVYELRAVCALEASALAAFLPDDAVTGASSRGSGSSNCFIATAAYGSPLEPQVQVLRAFRDTYLQSNDIGRWLVAQYYRLSPPLADVIRTHDSLRTVVRLALTPVIWVAGLLMHMGSGPPMVVSAFVLLGAMSAGWLLGWPRVRRSRP